MQAQGIPRASGREQRALGRAVREIRARRGMSQEQLGARAQLHRNFVGALERGETNATWRTVHRLTVGLRVPLSEMVAVYERHLRDVA